jgi:tetratricopeptide (TPR) repeat protein
LDPDNALAYYLEAKLLLEAGDTEGALAALEQARQLEEASAYSLQAAAFREQALEQSGLAPEAAKTVTALTAGIDEYAFLMDLSDDLLESGQTFLAAGDIQTAQEIFEAVHQLGTQLEEGASLLQEKLAALDIQRAAINVLEGLYTAIQSVEGIEFLTTQAIDLTVALGEIGNFFTALDELFLGEGSTGFFTMISDVILMQGDLTLFDYLDQFGAALLGQPPQPNSNP